MSVHCVVLATGRGQLHRGMCSFQPLIFMTCGALASDVPVDNAARYVVGWLGCGLLIAVLSISALHAVRLHVKPMPMYSHFICHHKAGAAQSRIMQLIIREHTHQPCFIDADHLLTGIILLEQSRHVLGILLCPDALNDDPSVVCGRDDHIGCAEIKSCSCALQRL